MDIKLNADMFSSVTYFAKYNWLDDGYKIIPTFTGYDTLGVITEKQDMVGKNIYINKKVFSYMKPDTIYPVLRMSRNDYTCWGLKITSNGKMYECYGKSSIAEKTSELLTLNDDYMYVTNWSGSFYFYDIDPQWQPFITIANPTLIGKYTITKDTIITCYNPTDKGTNMLYSIDSITDGAANTSANIIIPELYLKGYVAMSGGLWSTDGNNIIQYAWKVGQTVWVKNDSYVNDPEGLKKELMGKTIYYRRAN